MKLGNGLSDGRKSLFRKTWRAEKSFFVEQIIFHHQPSLWIEPRPALDHQFQIVIGRESAMLNFCAACERGCAHRVFVSVHQRAQSEFLRFVTSSVKLLLRKSHRAVANAIRSEDLD